MFLIMAGVAEVINVVSHLVIQNIRQEANMFSITPYYPTTQPILHEVALALGIPAEIALYLALIILASLIIYAVFYVICGKKRK